MRRPAMVGSHDAHPAEQHGHFRPGEPHQLCPVEQHFFGADDIIGLGPVAEAICQRFERRKAFCIGHLICGITTSGREGNCDIKACRLCGHFDTKITRQHNDVRDRGTCVGGNALQHRQYACEPCGFIAFPVFLRREANTGTIGTPAHVRAAIGPRTVPGGRHHVREREASIGNLRFDGGHVIPRCARRNWILPDQIFAGCIGADVAHAGAEVAVGQFEPSPGKRIVEIDRIRHEFLTNRIVDRVDFHRHIGVRHHRIVTFVRIGGVAWLVLLSNVDGLPLPSASRRFAQLPFMPKEHVKIAHIEFERLACPSALNTRGHRIGSFATLRRVAPAKALVLNLAGFGFCAKRIGIPIAMGFADGMSPDG